MSGMSRGCPRKACQVVSLELAVMDGGGGLANFAGPSLDPSRAKVGQKNVGQKKSWPVPQGGQHLLGCLRLHSVLRLAF